MPMATVGSRGRLTLPREVREVLGVSTGDQVAFTMTNGTCVIAAVHRQEAPLRDIRDLKGVFAGYAAKAVSIEEMTEATAKGALDGAGLG